MVAGSYLHDRLLPENLYGHTKKVQLLRASLERLRQRRGGARLRVLDIGCGSGHAVTRFLARAGDEVTGIDLHAPSIEYAAREFAAGSLRFEVKSVEELADVSALFDAIVLADVLEHVDDPAQTLQLAARLLSDGGCVLVSVPNGRGPFEIESFVRRLPVLGWGLSVLAKVLSRLGRLVTRRAAPPAERARPIPYNASSGHLHFFTRSRIVRMAADAGLDIVHWCNLAFVCGPFSGELVPETEAVCSWNTSIAEKLPYWATSAWYFELTPAKLR
jgi:2-polyprenyl-3-methyl-5-hydroxy-6-metoxy-1,4-benzoquinol methylase